MILFIQCLFSFFIQAGNSSAPISDFNGKRIAFNDTTPQEEIISDTILANKKLDESIALFRASKYNKALEAGEQALQIIGTYDNKLKAEIFANIGRCHIRLQNNGDAIRFFEKAGGIYQSLAVVPHINIAINYSNIGICYKNEEDYDRALEYYQKAIDYAISTIGEEHEGIGSAHMNKGNVFRRMGKYEEAIKSYLKSIKIFEKVLEPPHARYGIAYLNLGLTYENIKDLEHAVLYNEKALESFLATVGEKHYYTYSLYHNIGIIHKETGEYEKALDYEHKALAIGREMFKTDPTIGDVYTMMGSVHREIGAYEKSLEYYQKGFDFKIEHYPENLHGLTYSYNGLGLVYGDLKQYEKAIYFFEKDIEIEKQLFGNDFPDLSYPYNSLAYIYTEKKELKKALEHYHKALDISLGNFGEHHPRTAFVLTNIGEHYLNQGDLKNALQYFDRAEAAFGADGSSEKNWPAVSSYGYLPRIFRGKGKVLNSLYLKSKNPELLNRSINEWDKGIAFLEHLRWSLESDQAKNILSEKSYPIYEGAIQSNITAFKNYNDEVYLENIFKALEKSKNFIMLQTIADVKAKQYSGIPDSLLEKEKQLKIKIDWQEEQRVAESEKDELDEKKIDELNTDIFDNKNKLSALVSLFEKNNPQYFNLKYGNKYPDINAVQNQLSLNQTMLEYFVGDSTIYVFVISKNKKKVVQINRDFPLEEWVEELRESITGYHLATDKSEKLFTETSSKYRERAYQLHQKLIAPLGPLSENLVIMPDGILWNVPFEILLKNNKGSRFSELEYFVLEHQISYNFSAALWLEMKGMNADNKDLLAIAPSFDHAGEGFLRSGVFTQLQFNEKEAEDIANKTGGISLTGPAANKNYFIENAGQYGLLHLATHVHIDEDNSDYSYLAFTPSDDDSIEWKLYVRELYNQYYPAEMVVLSACESGIGKLQKGEGLISLSRGFAYAGAKSMVTSLWQVNDQATANIMSGFYENLKNGDPKNTALWKAKIDYLKNQKEDRLASPFYWGAFVAFGDMEAIGFAGNNNWYYWAGLLFLLLAAIWFFKKKIS